MKNKIIIGFTVLLIIIGGYSFFKGKTGEKYSPSNSPTPTSQEIVIQTQPVTGFYPEPGVPYLEYFTDHSVVLNGYVIFKINSATTWFEYGTDPKLLSGVSKTEAKSYSYVAQNLGSPYNNVKFSEKIEGLFPATIYYHRAMAKDNQGQIIEGQIYSFTTKENTTGLAPIVRSLLTGGGYSYDKKTNTFTHVTIRGEFLGNDLSTETWFEYGQTKSLGNSTGHHKQTINVGTFSDEIPSLPMGKYYFRAVAKNSAGVVYGEILEASVAPIQ